MYIITFYSFKGGVGRSMALANAGALLAKRGHRVLLVDFDLEAPGLHTFDSSAESTPGIVDFVHKYLETNEAPSFEGYFSECKINDKGPGKIWLMPAGAPSTYPVRYAAIDWKRLYAEQDGYLLFEDLKAQWQASLQPDYVLIDSRTGFTDIAGICTRQLPDAVCLLYFPNAQNLFGLSRVVSDVREQNRRNEETEVADRRISIYLAASNVPDLDDENAILAKNLRQFEGLAERGEPKPIVIHHYQSLSLISQSIFAVERPNSRLTKEYEELVSHITSDNLADESVALRRLQAAVSSRAPTLSDRQILDMLSAHASNPQVIAWVARYRRLEGDRAEALLLLDRAWKLGIEDPEVLVDHAQLALDCEQTEKAKEIVGSILNRLHEDSTFGLLATRVTRLAIAVGFNSDEVASSPAIQALDARRVARLMSNLQESTSETALAYAVGQRLVERVDNPMQLRSLTGELALTQISLGRLNDAVQGLRTIADTPEALGIQNTFNMGVALHFLDSRAEARQYFESVLASAEELESFDDANLTQCLAFAAFAVGQSDRARAYVADTRGQLAKVPRRTFSCWRYFRATPKEFEADLGEIERYFLGEPLKPFFLR